MFYFFCASIAGLIYWLLYGEIKQYSVYFLDYKVPNRGVLIKI